MSYDQEFQNILNDLTVSIVEKVFRCHNTEVLFESLNLKSLTGQELEKEIFRLALKGEDFSASFMRRLHRNE